MENRREIYSVKIKAGKRVYLFDVRQTSTGDYYITISERRRDPDGRVSKQRIFLYKEDFNKFLQGLTDTIEYVKKELLPHYDFSRYDRAPIYYNEPSEEEEGEEFFDEIEEFDE